ncbi:MAG: hypothetical protein WC559_06285 [Candidatus Omnitrophota bacterium]
MRAVRCLTALFLVFSLAGCFCRGYNMINTSEGMVACPKCCPLVTYSGTSVSVKGVDLGMSKVPVKIGEITVEPKTIQTAGDIVQALDNRRIALCELLPTYATTSKAKLLEALDAMREKEEILTQFVVIVNSKDGTAIGKFVDYYFPQVQKLNAGTGVGVKALSVKSQEKLTEPSDGIKVAPLKALLQ